MRGTTHRLKISTTVAPETHEYLASLVQSGRAPSIAEALDQAPKGMFHDRYPRSAC